MAMKGLVLQFLDELEAVISSPISKSMVGPDVIQGALQVFVYLEGLGLLEEHEADKRRQRLFAVDEKRTEQTVDKFRARLARGEAEWPPRSLDSSSARALLGPSKFLGSFRILSVEIYTNYVALRWLQRESDDDSDEMDLSITDDVGTKYLLVGSMSSGDPREGARGETTFVPSVPPEATCLYIASTGESSLRIAL